MHRVDQACRFVAIMFGLLATTSAHASQPALTGHYALSWDIAPHDVPAEPIWVKEQGEIVATRLVPRGLFAPRGDIVGDDGELLVPLGTQMVLVGAPYPMACNVNPSAGGKAKSKRVCVIDSDSDGIRDTGFSTGKGGDYWMALEDDLEDEKLFTIRPVELTTLDPASMIDAPYLSFHYQRILDGGLTLPLTQEGGNMVRFHFKVGREKNRMWMVRECRSDVLPSHCASAAFPSTMEIAGLELELLERRKEDVKLRILHRFGGKPVKFVDINDGYNSGSLLYAD